MSIAITLVVALIVGLTIGGIARLFITDARPGTLTISLALAAAGALVAGLVGELDGWYQGGHAPRFVVSLLGALTPSAAYRLWTDDAEPGRGVASAHTGRGGAL